MGRRVAACRVFRGIGTTALAERAGISRGTLWRLEAGQAPGIAAETLAAIAAELGVTVDYLLTGEGAGPADEESAPAGPLARAA